MNGYAALMLLADLGLCRAGGRGGGARRSPRGLLAAGLALSAGLFSAADEVTTETDTRGLRILAAWRLGVPAVLVTMAAALTHHRTKAFSAAGQFRSRRRRK